MNQHYVPRAYLKNFSEKKGKEYFVWVYDKTDKRSFNTNIKNICSEVDFYTLDEENSVAKDLFVVEKIYSNGIEPLFLNAYHILNNPNVFHITHLQRAEILISIFQFYLRNPKLLRRSIKFHTHEVLNRCKEARGKGQKGITYLEEDFSFRDYTETEILNFIEKKVTKYFKEKHIGGIGDVGTFHEYAKLEVMVIRDNDPSEFFTSDNPLIFHDHVTNNENPLLRSKEFTITLNKKVAVKVYHDNSKQLNFIYRCYIPNISVASVNKLIMEQSSRFIIATKSALDIYNDLSENFLNNTSAELKIDAIKQLIAMFPETVDNKPCMDILKHYQNLYQSNGTLSDKEQYEMLVKIRMAAANFVGKRIQE